jgi:hypothetical protein
MAVAITQGSASGRALVAVPAKERGDLGLTRASLQQQPRPEASDLLDHLTQVRAGSANSWSISARTRSTGDTRDGTGVGLLMSW